MSYIKVLSSHANVIGKLNGGGLRKPYVAYITDENRIDWNKYDIDYSFIPSMNGDIKFVDLGLPSGNLWADRNIGASTEEDKGNLYAYGEINTKNDYSYSNYKWFWGMDGAGLVGTKYSTTTNTKLLLEDDAAYNECIKLFPDNKNNFYWETPSYDDAKELINNCIIENTFETNKYGLTFNTDFKLTSKTDSTKFIHLSPACFMLSNLYTNKEGCNYMIVGNENYQSDSNGVFVSGIWQWRYRGFHVRPIIKMNNN